MTYADQLQRSIRAITVEAPDDQPNGRAERALVFLEAVLCGKGHWKAASKGLRLDRAREAATSLCEALADDTRTLREAAEPLRALARALPSPVALLRELLEMRDGAEDSGR